jgi:COP9 signalosome complex subunit 5
MSSADSGDRLFHYYESEVDAMRAAMPWMNDPKYFKVVKVSPSAVTKMMMHSQFGVDYKTLKVEGD